MFRSIATIVVAATIAFAAPAFAQKVGTPEEVVTQQDNTKIKAKGDQPDGAVIIRPAADTSPAVTDVACVRRFLNVPALKKPGRFIFTVQDVQDGLLEKMVVCNGKLAEAQKTGTKSVDVRVTYGDDGFATVKVPADRAQFVRARFHSTHSDLGLGEQVFWQSTAFGDRTEITLEPDTKMNGEVVGKKQP